MSEIKRVSITAEEELLDKFDVYLKKTQQGNRSEVIRGLIRECLLDADLENDDSKMMVGSFTIVFDHARRELTEKLIREGHHHHNIVVSTMHVHVTTRECIEVMVVKGKASELIRFSEHMKGLKGVTYGKLVFTPAT